jgi:hypothetical protein
MAHGGVSAPFQGWHCITSQIPRALPRHGGSTTWADLAQGFALPKLCGSEAHVRPARNTGHAPRCKGGIDRAAKQV